MLPTLLLCLLRLWKAPLTVQDLLLLVHGIALCLELPVLAAAAEQGGTNAAAAAAAGGGAGGRLTAGNEQQVLLLLGAVVQDPKRMFGNFKPGDQCLGSWGQELSRGSEWAGRQGCGEALAGALDSRRGVSDRP
jgi:hypothetical protein